MKKLKKRLLAVALTAAATAAMAMPSFAAARNGEGDYYFRAYNGSGAYLNSWGNSVADGTPIRLYSYTGDSTQCWRVYKASNGTYSLRSCANTSLAINRDVDNKRAILWTWKNGRVDSDMTINRYGNTNDRYQFCLINGKEYLTAEASASGSHVCFKTFSGDAARWVRY